MNNKMILKKFVIGLVFAVLITIFMVSANAATISTNVPAGVTLLTKVGSGNSVIKSITVLNTNATTFANVSILDGNTNSASYTRAAFVSVSESKTMTTNIYTDVAGNKQTNVYPTVTRSYVTNNSASINFPTVLNFTVSTNNTTYTWVGSAPMYRGIAVNTTVPITITVNYDK